MDRQKKKGFTIELKFLVFLKKKYLLYLTSSPLLSKLFLKYYFMSTYTTLLSSKNQFTLPVELLNKLGWKNGQRFTLFIDGNSVILKTSENILEDITKIVSKYKLPKISVEEALKKTKTKHVSTKFTYDDK